MNIINLLKSLVLSIIVSVGIKLIYNVESIYVLGGINLLVFVISKMILDIEEKNSKNELNRIEETTNTKIDEIISSISLLDNNIKNIVKNDILESIKDGNEKLYHINKDLFNQGKELVVLKDLSIDIKKELIEISKSSKYIYEIGNMLNKELEQIKKNNENLQNQINQEENIREEIRNSIKCINVQIDKLMDINNILKLIEEKNTDILNEIGNEVEEIKDVKYEIDSLRSSINNSINESIESHKNILNKYDVIQKSFTKEIAQITSITNNTVDLLNDSYKVLNEVCTSI